MQGRTDDSDVDVVTSSSTKPIHVIHTPSSVGHILWKPASRGDILATTSCAEHGDILIWNLSEGGSLNVPACILRGHSEPCMDFSWLDTPIYNSKYESTKQSLAQKGCTHYCTIQIT